MEAIQKPHENCYWIIPKKLLAGEYPRTKERITSRSRIEAMFRDGITRFIDLTTKNDNLLTEIFKLVVASVKLFRLLFYSNGLAPVAG